MTCEELEAVARRLDDFLADLLAPMGRSERRQWAKIYVQGLLLEGERKSIEPMAGRIEGPTSSRCGSLLDKARGRSRKCRSYWPTRWSIP